MAGRGHTAARSAATWHFPVATGLLLVLTLVAFGDNLVTDVHQPSNSNPVMVVHGLFLLAWMALLLAQSLLVFQRRTTLHRKLGIAGFAVGIGVVLSTVVLFWAVFRGFAAMSPQVIANRVMLPSYALCLFAAWRMRQRPDWHKRFIYVGTLLLLEPVLARTFDPLVVPLLPPMAPATDEAVFTGYMLATWNGFFLALLAYDRATLRRLHPVSLGGLAWLWLVNLFAFSV